MSLVGLGVGHGSCFAHRGWHSSSTAVGDQQLRQSYITPHCLQFPPVNRIALFVAATALRPTGESNRRYAKFPTLKRSPAACTPRSLRALRAVVCRPNGVLAVWHMSGAARMVMVSGFAVSLVCAPAHPWGLLASQHRPRGLPVRPQGAPSEPRQVMPPGGGQVENVQGRYKTKTSRTAYVLK
jgi:hypothetical protein